jgi:hypothetical protein
VTVTIPVGLEFDKPPSIEELRDAAIENFVDHPALNNPRDLALYIDKVKFDSASGDHVVLPEPTDIEALAGGIPEDEDFDAFLRDIYEARGRG